MVLWLTLRCLTYHLGVQAVDTRRNPPVEVAIKLLPRGDFMKIFKTYIKREILHQSTLRHPFIVAIKQACSPVFAQAHAGVR